MTVRQTLLFWVAVVAGIVLFVHVFSPILLPFILGLGIAYLIDPVVDRLQRRGLSRFGATMVIFAVFVLVLVALAVLLVPVLANQFVGFFERLPDYVDQLRTLAEDIANSQIGQALNLPSESSVGEALGEGAGWISGMVEGLWASGRVIFNVITTVVVMPIVVFYMLLDWDRMVAVIDSALPRAHITTIRRLAADMNAKVSGFIRGQFVVMLIQGTFYAVALSLVGLNFGLFIGFGAGIIGFIPFVGALVGGAVSIGVALVQFLPDWGPVIVVIVIFLAGQVIEDNILRPKLIGPNVGLHPVWLIFSVLAFAQLFGFVGMLVAVPAAAAIGVLARFGIERYKESQLFRGNSGDDPPAPPPAVEEAGAKSGSEI